MPKKEIKTSKDGNCPNCGSSNVLDTMGHIGARPASSPKFPKPKKRIWKCFNCDEIFSYKGSQLK